mmetsp:Transcript_11234/g.39111  ORF Transcript_11234/g.39111 Transcript_11234/m.39111 type:complete len:241 (-) Transcript_11234:90-812(-)
MELKVRPVPVAVLVATRDEEVRVYGLVQQRVDEVGARPQRQKRLAQPDGAQAAMPLEGADAGAQRHARRPLHLAGAQAALEEALVGCGKQRVDVGRGILQLSLGATERQRCVCGGTRATFTVARGAWPRGTRRRAHTARALPQRMRRRPAADPACPPAPCVARAVALACQVDHVCSSVPGARRRRSRRIARALPVVGQQRGCEGVLLGLQRPRQRRTVIVVIRCHPDRRPDHRRAPVPPV